MRSLVQLPTLSGAGCSQSPAMLQGCCQHIREIRDLQEYLVHLQLEIVIPHYPLS